MNYFEQVRTLFRTIVVKLYPYLLQKQKKKTDQENWYGIL